MSDLSILDSTESSKARKIREARQILAELGLPRAQLNDRSAFTLLALLDLKPDTPWREATDPLIGITPIMDWSRQHYDAVYAPNSRETFRRFTMHQLVEAALVLYNPDEPTRPVNSPKAVYQIEPKALQLLRSFNSPQWADLLTAYRAVNPSLRDRYAKSRGMQLVPVQLADGQSITLTPGKHSELIKAIIEEFAPRFVPGAKVIYAGDTGKKWGYFDQEALTALGVIVDAHGKMPDVVIYYPEKDWLLLVESVTSHGPVDGKRHDELARLFRSSKAGLIYVTAFPSRAVMARYVAAISWETEVWVAEAPDHLIHFDGERFLGPYPTPSVS